MMTGNDRQRTNDNSNEDDGASSKENTRTIKDQKTSTKNQMAIHTYKEEEGAWMQGTPRN